VVVLMVRPPQPQETDTSVTQTIQVRTRMFTPGALIGISEAI